VQDLAELLERRAYECRLTPDRALATVEEAEQFLHDRAERELKRWFSWQWYWDDAIVDELVAERRVGRIDGYVTTAGTPS